MSAEGRKYFLKMKKEGKGREGMGGKEIRENVEAEQMKLRS